MHPRRAGRHRGQLISRLCEISCFDVSLCRSRVGQAHARHPHLVIHAGDWIAPDLDGRFSAPGSDRVRLVYMHSGLVCDACAAVLGDQDVAATRVAASQCVCGRRGGCRARAGRGPRQAVLAGPDPSPVGDETVRGAETTSLPGFGTRPTLELQPPWRGLGTHLWQGGPVGVGTQQVRSRAPPCPATCGEEEALLGVLVAS